MKQYLGLIPGALVSYCYMVSSRTVGWWIAMVVYISLLAYIKLNG